MTRSKHRELWWAGATIGASTAVFLYLGLDGWPGAAHACVAIANCYCEAPRAGPIAQPANTWSCLGWAALGLWIAWDSEQRREHGSSPDSELRPFASSFYAGLYAAIVILLALGGMLFHSSLTEWGAKLDIVSMYLFVNFWIVYQLARSYSWSRRTFLCAYLGATALLLVPRVVFGSEDTGLAIFGALLAFAVATEFWISRSPHLRWIWLGLGAFGFAHLIQAVLPCDPDSLLQPHAVLHLIEVVPPVALYIHLFVATDSRATTG